MPARGASSSLAATLNGVLQSEALGALLIDKSARIWRNCFAASCGSGGPRLILEKADLSPPWPRKPLRTSTTKDKMSAFSQGYVSQIKPLPKQAARPIDALNACGLMSLSQRCGELRRAGVNVASKWVKDADGKPLFKAYRIVSGGGA